MFPGVQKKAKTKGGRGGCAEKEKRSTNGLFRGFETHRYLEKVNKGGWEGDSERDGE
jgi:hypothetical protein